MRRNLYQKDHGMPGVPMSFGFDGADGNSGNNIYIGYVGDFFDSTPITVDNFVRTAQKDVSTGYYTGIFDSSLLDASASAYARSVQTEYGSYDASADPDKNNYFGIKDTDVWDGSGAVSPFEYFKESYPSSSEESATYAKVDFSKTGKDVSGNSDAWNRNSNPRWKSDPLNVSVLDFEDSLPHDASMGSDTPYPYTDASVRYDKSVLIRPGKNTNRNSQGFELFSVDANGVPGTFSDAPSSGTYDSSVFTDITDSPAHGTDDPSIGEIINWDTNYVTGETIKVDFLKLKPDMTDSVYVTDKLSSRIKSGDIIYFYTDRDEFAVDNMIHRMVYVTPELEGCDLDTLLASSAVTDPFSFKYMSDAVIGGESYVYSISNAVSGFYRTQDSSFVRAYGPNFTKLLSYMSKSALNLGILSDAGDGAGGTPEENEMVHMQSYINPLTGSTLTFSGLDSSLGGKTVIRPLFRAGEDLVSIPLKATDLFVKKDNVGNVESMSTVSPEHTYISPSGKAYTVTYGDYDENGHVVRVTEDEFLSDTSFEDYECGFNVLCYERGTSGKAVFADKSMFLRFTPSMRKSVTLKKLYGDDTAYDLTFWIREGSGIARFGERVTFVYNPDMSRYEILTEEESGGEEEGSVSFASSSLSADAADTVVTTVVLPEGAENPRFFINSSEISMESPSYAGAWYTLNTLEDAGDGMTYRFSGSVKSNLPVIGMTGTAPKTTREYIANPGVMNSIVNGCDVFNDMLSGVSRNTEARSATFTVLYDMKGKSRKSFYKLTQPGYTEKRRVPKVNLNLRKDLEFIENGNRMSNGVLCNQFQFFVDIDISDFSAECWGSYEEEENISLDIEIRNSQSDYDTIRKYSIQNAKAMSTLHVNSVKNADGTENETDFHGSHNYFRIRTHVIGTDIDDVCTATRRELIESSAKTGNSSVKDSFNMPVTEDGCVMLRKDDFATETETLDSGLNDSVTVSIGGVRFSDISDGKKFRIMVDVEYGNPLFSRLFMKFYVSNLVVNYGSMKFYVGTSNLAVLEQTGSMNYYSYMYATEPFNAFICPVSLTAVPADSRAESYYAEGQKQIQTSLSKYVPVITPPRGNEERNHMIIGQRVDWFDFSLIKKFFQDNVKTISVDPADALSLDGVIDPDFMFSDFGKIGTTRNNRNYMSVVYSSRAEETMEPKDVNDIRVFTYPLAPENEKSTLACFRYSQLENRAPIYTRQNYAYEVRTPELSNSVAAWNKEFQKYGAYNAGLFSGHVSSFGNGYMFLDADSDEGQYDSFGVYSLADTVSMNGDAVLDKKDVRDFVTPDVFRTSQPQDGKWYDSPLIQVKWQYPKYYQDSTTHNEYIDAYDLIPCGEYKYGDAGTFTLPYSLTYGIYPRCAYDYEKDDLIIFMLRCPSVLEENKRMFTQGDSMTGYFGDVPNEKQNVAK